MGSPVVENYPVKILVGVIFSFCILPVIAYTLEYMLNCELVLLCSIGGTEVLDWIGAAAAIAMFVCTKLFGLWK